MKKEEYIESVLKHIHNRAFVNTIANELDEHIDDRQMFYKDCGYDNDTAMQKAIEHMGSADNVGEQMNMLYSNTKALIIGIISLLVYIGGLIFAIIDFLNFAVISLDPDVVYLYVFIISFITFASGMLCYTLALKHRMRALITVFGLVNLVGMLSPFTFLAFGNSIASFIFNFPSAAMPQGLHDTIIRNPIGYGTANDLAYMLILIFTALFFFVPLVSGIISLLCAKEIKAQQNGFFSEKRLKHFKRYGALLLALTIIGTVTLPVEATAYMVEIWKEQHLMQKLEKPNTNKAFEVYDSIELPFDKADLNSISSKAKYNYSDANAYGYVLTTVYLNEHYFIQLADNDADGLYETKRIFANHCSGVKIKILESITADMTTSEIFEWIPREQINDYSYTVTDNGYEEEIFIYSSNGAGNMQRNPSELHIIAQNGIITEFRYHSD